MPLKVKRNMNNIDRGIRAVVGTSLLLLGPLTDFFTTDTLSEVILGVLGTTAVLSAVFAHCFLYKVTGFDTTRQSK